MTEIVIPALNDVWMDNGVETLYILLKEAQNNSFSVKIDNNSLIITLVDYNKFKESVGVAIQNRRSNLIVIDEDKKLGVKKEVKKDYILIQEGTKVGEKSLLKRNCITKKQPLILLIRYLI